MSKPQVFLSRPNRTIVSKIKEKYTPRKNVKLDAVNELTFKIPIEIDINHILEKNHNLELVREKYLILLKEGLHSEWYVIIQINDIVTDSESYKEIKAMSLAYELKSKTIKGYLAESKGANYVLNEILAGTTWSVGSLDADFELSKRTFEFNDGTLLNALYQVAQTYNAIVTWDTVNKEVNLIKPELHGTDRGLRISPAQYLKTLEKESDSDELITRLNPYGKDGLTIHEVTETGQGYLEDFSYYLYPFNRDENKNVIEQSNYMTDSLCHAILDYKDKIAAVGVQFKELRDRRLSINTLIRKKESDLIDLLRDEKVINDIMRSQQFHEPPLMQFEKYNFSGSARSHEFKLLNFFPYAAFIKTSSANLMVKLNGVICPIPTSNKWIMLGKVKNTIQMTIEVTSASPGTEIYIQTACISEDEYTSPNNGESLVDIYNLDHKKMQISALQSELSIENNNRNTILNEIKAIQLSLSDSSNFSEEQLNELAPFINNGDYKDEKFIEAEDLLKASYEKFDEYKTPQISLKIDIVNFLDILEEQENWNKLYLGDYIQVKYDKLDIFLSAKIIEIEYDYDESNITLTIANVKELNDNSKKLKDYLQKGSNAATIVDSNKKKWTEAVVDSSEMSRLFDHFWDKYTNKINMAINQTVIIDDKGITVIDPADPNRFLRMTNGVIGLTRSGGLKYETAISADGIIAEMVLGKLILGQRVTIGDENGIWMTEGPQTTITDRCGREAMKLGLLETDPDLYGLRINRYDSSDACSDTIVNKIRLTSEDGFVIEKKKEIGYENVAWLDNNGLLNVKKMQIDYMDGLLSNGIEIDSINGIVITRSDKIVRAKFNAIDGLVFERFENNQWRKKFYFEPNGRFYAEDLYTKRLTVVNDMDDVLIDARTDYLNIGRFETIIADGKLTAIEKLTLKQEWETIQTEYQKLIQQANLYKTSVRDNHQTTLVNIPPLTNAYNQLYSYVVPLLADMSATTAIDRDEFKTKFQSYYDQVQRVINEITDALKWSSLQLGQDYNKVVIDAKEGIVVTRGDNVVKTVLNATKGISIERNSVPKFYVDTNGILHAEDLIAKRLRITTDPFGGGTDDDILIDAEQRLIDFSKFNLIVGKLGADNISSDIITASQGFISSLTANKLMTIGKSAENTWSNYIHIEDNRAMWTTGKAITGSGVHETNSMGEPYYWKDANRSGLTTEVTAFPVMKYEYDAKVKLLMDFKGIGDAAYPRQIFGLGDGIIKDPSIDDGLGNFKSGRGFIEKPAGSFDFVYYNQSFGRERSMRFLDDGIDVFCENARISIDSKDFYSNVSGELRLAHDSGSNIEISSTGTITIEHKNGAKISFPASGNINIETTGEINFKGSKYNFQ
ncbi:hypothetical protein EBB07_29595 [Paenibacillaceae bacterium]|nr:hypothetical protein EBB07_29595 [Paenibacillaceae bacterium]